MFDAKKTSDFNPHVPQCLTFWLRKFLVGYKAGDNCEEQRRTGPLHFLMNAQVFLQDMKFCFFLFLFFATRSSCFFQISPNCNPRRKIWHFRLDLESICFSLWLLRAFLDGRELQQSQLAQILQLWSFIIIIGYFYGIIHSINGVLLVLITRKGPWQWRYTKTGWWNVNECNMTTCYIVNNRRQKEHWMYTTNDFKNQH